MVHASLAPSGDAIQLDPDWREIEILKLVPGSRWNPHKKIWTVPLTFTAFIQLRELFHQTLDYGADLVPFAQRFVEQAAESIKRRDLIEPETEVDSLYRFQAAGVEWMLTSGSGLLGDEMGVGKTAQALAWLDRTQLYPSIIVCPNRVKWHWAERMPRWAPGAVPYVLDGTASQRRKIIEQSRDDPMAVIIINYESMSNFSRLEHYGDIRLRKCKQCDPRFGEDITPSRCHRHPKELNSYGFRSAILDEVHRIGNPESNSTRATWAVVHDKSVEARWGLTGSPDNMERLWAIMHAVRPEEYQTRSKFMDRYALREWNAFGGSNVIGIRPDTREELYRFLDPAFRRMVQSVVLPQLPPVSRCVYYAELTPAQRRAYDELEDKLYTTLPNGQMLISKNPLVSKTRMLQFAAGTVVVDKPDEDDIETWKVKITEPSPKLDAFEEVLDELGNSRFVVACEHRDVVDMTAERLAARGIAHELIVGRTHPQVSEQACRSLKTGALQAIVFTNKAGGTGLDMSGAPVLIRLQRSHSLIDNVQTEKRNYRIGSEVHERVVVIDIVTRNTREEHQMQRLTQKMEALEEIARDRRWLELKLTSTPPTDVSFGDLVRQLNDLHERESKIYSGDLLLGED